MPLKLRSSVGITLVKLMNSIARRRLPSRQRRRLHAPRTLSLLSNQLKHSTRTHRYYKSDYEIRSASRAAEHSFRSDPYETGLVCTHRRRYTLVRSSSLQSRELPYLRILKGVNVVRIACPISGNLDCPQSSSPSCVSRRSLTSFLGISNHIRGYHAKPRLDFVE